MTTMLDLLIKMRVLDGDGTLSLTSIVLMVAVFKFAWMPLQTETLLALLGALTAHQGKKLIGQRNPSKEVNAAVAALGSQVTTLANKVQLLDNRTTPVGRR